MSLYVQIGVSLLGGAALGSIYFLTLWWMVQKLASGRGASGWVAASIVARLALVVGSFMLVVFWGSWPALLAALVGFVAARMVLVRQLPPPLREPGVAA